MTSLFVCFFISGYSLQNYGREGKLIRKALFANDMFHYEHWKIYYINLHFYLILMLFIFLSRNGFT